MIVIEYPVYEYLVICVDFTVDLYMELLGSGKAISLSLYLAREPRELSSDAYGLAGRPPVRERVRGKESECTIECKRERKIIFYTQCFSLLVLDNFFRTMVEQVYYRMKLTCQAFLRKNKQYDVVIKRLFLRAKNCAKQRRVDRAYPRWLPVGLREICVLIVYLDT